MLKLPAAILAALTLLVASVLAADAVTQVTILDPGQLNATSATTGSCGVPSIASGRTNAWRCNIDTPLPSGANLLDPCFSLSDDASVVVCPTNYPATLDAIDVTLESPLGCIPQVACTNPTAANITDEPNVAFIDLGGGVVCGLNTGATFVVGFERANFGCSDRTWIVGQPFALTDGTWEVVRATIGVGQEPIVASKLTLVPVVHAWEE